MKLKRNLTLWHSFAMAALRYSGPLL